MWRSLRLSRKRRFFASPIKNWHSKSFWQQRVRFNPSASSVSLQHRFSRIFFFGRPIAFGTAEEAPALPPNRDFAFGITWRARSTPPFPCRNVGFMPMFALRTVHCPFKVRVRQRSSIFTFVHNWFLRSCHLAVAGFRFHKSLRRYALNSNYPPFVSVLASVISNTKSDV